jgi:hypothetical protein
VLRAILLAAVLCVSFETSGLGSALGDLVCSDECPLDDSGLPCAPNCHECSCCSLPRLIGTDVVEVVLPAPARGTWTVRDTFYASPEPSGLLHVPRPLLA